MTQKSKPPVERPGSLEDWILDQRRQTLGGDGAQRPRFGRRALALSGGGIRSATFALGVVQAAAEARNDLSPDADAPPSPLSPVPEPGPGDAYRASFFSTFEYLSTVSGGGYLGGFLCSLFRPHRLTLDRDAPLGGPAGGAQAPVGSAETAAAQLRAADVAAHVLCSGIPQRIRRHDTFDGDALYRAPLAWLRENGRYLTPTGTGDGIYAAALALRNWLSLHYVIGTVLLALLTAVIGLRALAAYLIPDYLQWERELLCAVLFAYSTPATFGLDHVWWSPLGVLCLAPLLLFGVPVGLSYWLLIERRDGSGASWDNRAAWTTLIVALGTAVFVAWSWWPMFGKLLCGGNDAFKDATASDVRLISLLLGGATICLAALLCFVVVSLRHRAVAAQRVAVTRGVEGSLILSLILAGLAVIDTLGQTLYAHAMNTGAAGSVLSPAALAGALVWLTKFLASKGSGKMPDFLKKLPLTTLAGLAGIVIFVLVGALWTMLANWIIWGGEAPKVGGLFSEAFRIHAWWTVALATLIAYFIGLFPGFINLSSLQSFYSARLTRAYLGASNGQRFIGKKPESARLSAAEPLPGDQIKLTQYFDEHGLHTLAPLHIINVTVNKTVDPAEQLVQRDRKGQPLAVLPCGFSLDGRPLAPYPGDDSARFTSTVQQSTVGQWVGTSGAAFSTGIGRETSLGMSLLMGAANVRLGTWWESGIGEPGNGKLPFMPSAYRAPSWLKKLAGGLFKTQRYLSYELRAQFHGTHRVWQYLSDGGHFENTAIYELLRSRHDGGERRHDVPPIDRGVGQIFASDNGADPLYQFDDLGNLMRLAKIDLDTEIRVVDPDDPNQLDTTTGSPFAALEGLFGATGTFQRLSRPGAMPKSGPCALLLYAGSAGSPLTQIVMIKPLVTEEAPADVLQYTRTHPAFPQEATADQFFDEAQWESYRALGEWQARRIFNPEVLKALAAHAASVSASPPPASPPTPAPTPTPVLADLPFKPWAPPTPL